MFALLLAAAIASPAPAASPDPYAVYAAAIRKLATLEQPSFIDVTEKRVNKIESATTGQEVATEEILVRTIFDSTTRRECVFDEPNDREVVIGASFFAPDTWLMARHARPEPQPSTPSMVPDLSDLKDPSDLKVIADVVALNKPTYDIRLADTIADAGTGPVYHLILHPHSDPSRHNLRELWVDSATNHILRAIVRGTYRPMPHDAIEETYALEDFGQVGPYWLVIHTLWTYAPPFSGVRLRFETTVRTMRFPASMPAWLFDEHAFAQHAGELAGVLAVPATPSPP